jgi:zinc transporter, ZIP family
MDDFLLVFLIAFVAAGLTYLGVPAAERFDVSRRVVSAALQFASGIITALVAFSLMPPAVRDGPLTWIVLGFFIGGALFVSIEYFSAVRISTKPGSQDSPSSSGGPASLGLYIGILADLLIDGVVIGIGSSMTLATGLLLALGMAISTFPLAFVTTATAKAQGVPLQRRKQLGVLFFLAILGGALLGFLILGRMPIEPRLIMIALASGFLITTVTQSLIPEANRDGEPSFAGILFIGGLSLYGLMSLTVK